MFNKKFRVTALILLFSFICFSSSKAIEAEPIPIDNTYIEGIITKLNTERTSQEVTEVRVYSFELDRPGKIDVHFISHINIVIFAIKDSDENVIRRERLTSGSSPFDFSLTLLEGKYYFHVYKEGPLGLLGATVSEDNVGDYKFKINFSPIDVSDGASNDEVSTHILKIGDRLTTLFASNGPKNHTYEVNIPYDGDYTLGMQSKLSSLNLKILDLDENELLNKTIYNEIYEKSLPLTKGEYLLILDSKYVGEYSVTLDSPPVPSPSESPSSDLEDMPTIYETLQVPTPQEESGDNKESGWPFWLDVNYLPAALVLACLAGVFGKIVEKRFR